MNTLTTLKMSTSHGPHHLHGVVVRAPQHHGILHPAVHQEKNFKNFHPNWIGSKLTLDVEKQSWDAALEVKLV